MGAAAGGAQVPEVGLAGLLRQLLERLPGVVPVQAPVAPRVAEVQQRGAVAEEVPSYLRMMEQLQKIGTGYFSGGTSPEEADSWRSRVERNFGSSRCPTEYRVDLTVHFLEGDAHLWWRSVTARRRQADMSWADFVAEFNAKYFPQEALDRMEARFLELTQGERSVREYDREFNRLLVYAGQGMEDDQAQMRRVSFERLEGRLVYQGVRPTSGSLVISAVQAEKMIEKGCEAYLVTISMPESVGQVAVSDIRVIQEFEDVFQSLQGLPPSRSDAFTIELEPGTTPLSKAPYRMAPAEMAELKKQLEDLLGKGFFRPSTSPWGAPVLFVKKKNGSFCLCIDYRG